ncbi:two-component system sensor histidine kinase CreC [Halopseudomonas pelagia]|uniref:two-component system sensor histidine kinase CreC n=1 Tax=Halopseudomonas pelagia TaxID=553151 RepID=UPI0003AB21D0|nr:two-component system sensor histidine kinase CreC [Halopseudomonas pelagia]
MSLGVRVFAAWFLLAGIGTLLFYNSVINQLPSSMRQASEEVLVDSSNLLAEVAALHWETGFAPGSPFSEALEAYRQRQLEALIWSREKTRPELQLYITDHNGLVLYHSEAALIGEDFSTWRDVTLTLQGEYGARTTRTDLEDQTTSFMYVAAPIYANDRLLGVLSLGQPTASLQPFITLANAHFWQRGGLILLAALLLGGTMSIWLTRSIRRLVNYVERVRGGERVALPVLGERELDRLARATEAMRAEIDGKAYVENYVHTLTHEMKSPLSAIRGAAELLQEGDLPAEARQRFTQNIEMETARMQRLIDRLLSLASVEKRQHLDSPETIDLATLVDTELSAKQSQALRKQLTLSQQVEPGLTVEGESFLLEQALSNLLDNAIDFSLPGGQVSVQASAKAEQILLSVSNDGPAVPDYALERVFERFYSLSRPDGQRKSTGLGLSLVSEVAQLHRGSVKLLNIPGQGVRAELLLPHSYS